MECLLRFCYIFLKRNACSCCSSLPNILSGYADKKQLFHCLGHRSEVRVSNVLLSGESSLFILGRAVLSAKIAMATAQHIFHGMMTSVFSTPISFFNTTPSSQIQAGTVFYRIQIKVDTDIP